MHTHTHRCQLPSFPFSLSSFRFFCQIIMHNYFERWSINTTLANLHIDTSIPPAASLPRSSIVLQIIFGSISMTRPRLMRKKQWSTYGYSHYFECPLAPLWCGLWDDDDGLLLVVVALLAHLTLYYCCRCCCVAHKGHEVKKFAIEPIQLLGSSVINRKYLHSLKIDWDCGEKPLNDWIIEPLLLLGVSLEKKPLDSNIYSVVCATDKCIIKVTQSWIFSKQINWHIDSRR